MDIKNNRVRRCLIITGMSGAGKSTVLNILEDQGLFAVDNIPPALLPQLLELLSQHRAAVQEGLAAVVDVRGGRLLNDLFSVVDSLKGTIPLVQVLFLDSSDESLVRRFETTRRRHPLGDHIPVLEGIQKERVLLAPVREYADVVLDTSGLSIRDLKDRLIAEFIRTEAIASVVFSSFGFKYGIPQDSDFMLDVRFLVNPHYIPLLSHLTGKDPDVQSYISTPEETRLFLARCYEFLDFLIPVYLSSGKSPFHIAVGCTGGQHRSVAVVEWLSEYYSKKGVRCVVRHRDIERGQVGD
ncbi:MULTISPECIES: RNase adapter RapZ [Aminobacterium]|uniref:RNase adapter RapZ n=1 Tax=Aminobacterium TaxID=81466 RepID=UPI00257FC6D0|nr:RNase adapter RapZ [Aminobacterium sp. UBA4987]